MSLDQSISPTPREGDFQLFGDTCHTKRLPPSLVCLLHSLHQSGIKAPAEFLIATVCYLLLESGLVPASISAELSSKVRTHWGFSFVAGIPKHSWNEVAAQIIEKYNELQNNDATKAAAASQTDAPEDIYTFTFKLLNHSDDELQLVIRKIFRGTTLCVMLCSEHHEQSASIILPLNGFVNSNAAEATNFDQIRNDPEHFFSKTGALSTQIKQQLIDPIRNVIMYESAYPNAALHGLPKEVLWSLFRYLRYDLETLQKVSHTCVYLRNMALTFLSESNIRLKHRRPTPITYDASDHIQPRSRRRIYNIYPWMFDPFNYSFNY